MKKGKRSLKFRFRRKRRSSVDVIFGAVNYTFLTLICLLMLYPFVYMVSVSLTGYGHVSEVRLLPVEVQFNAYKILFKLPNVLSGYKNTLLYTFLGVSVSMILTTSLAYALSKPFLVGRKFLNIFVIITMYFSGGLIPSYILLTNMLKWTNTLWVMIIPGAINTYNMIVMRTFFSSNIPQELEETAQIDGAGQIRMFFSIFLPLSKPILATITLFYFVAGWNSWLGAWLYLDRPELFPIQLVLRNAMNQSLASGVQGSLMTEMLVNRIDGTSLNYALTTCVVLPLFLVFPFLQKFFVKGVMIGSLKG